MSRRVYSWREGKLVEKTRLASSPVLPFVHGDTMKEAVQNPVTGFKTESVSAYMRDITEHNAKTGERLEVVTESLIERNNRNAATRPDWLTDERIKDKMDHARSILSDPSKRRAHYERNAECNREYDRYIKDR